MASHGTPRGSGIVTKNEHDRKKELKRIADYRSLVDSVNEEVRKKNHSRETLDLTSKLLQQNPEYYTVWNHRRLILRHLMNDGRQEVIGGDNGNQDDTSATTLIKSDLTFLIPLLRKFPKCYWIWNYRLWLLEQAAENCLTGSSLRMWEEDLALVSKMLSLDSRNFMAWGYRRTVVAGLERIRSMTLESLEPLTENEFEYSTKMVKANLSNFSAWHRRSKLIPQLLAERKADNAARRQMLESELEMVERALWTGGNDQSIWFYHQVLICNFDPRHARDAIAPTLSREEKIEYVSDEILKVLNMLDGAEDCKWIYQALINMSVLYQELSGQWPRDAGDVKQWLENLERLDPLRIGRWLDLKRQLSSGHVSL